MHTYINYIHTRIHAYIHTYTHTCTHNTIHRHTHAQIQTYNDTHTHTKYTTPNTQLHAYKHTQSGYIEVSSSDVRNKFLNQIEARSSKCVIGGKEVRLQQVRSQRAGKRNAILKLAMETFKQDSRCQGKNINIEWTGVRGVTIDGVYAFTQPASTVGAFDAPFTDLALP